MESRFAVVHYAEIGLKGRNRSFFERILAENILKRFQGVDSVKVERMRGRFLVRANSPLSESVWEEKLRTVFGIAYFAPAIPVSRDLEDIEEAILKNFPPEPPGPFRIRASRADKRFPLTSLELEHRLGEVVRSHTHRPVDLKNPAITVYLEITHTSALIYFTRKEGPGGLPVGVSGKVGLLLSGGIDSPVAGFLALKRGCRVVPIHFHSQPFGNWMASEEKAIEIVRVLMDWGMEPYIYIVPIGDLQQEIVLSAPSALWLGLYRRLMLRIAERIMERERGLALVTGDSLGQVASQTLESIVAISQATSMPILRPLIGFDKAEIVRLANSIGTYEISIRPGEDCCQFLLPMKVATRPALTDVLEAEKGLDMERMVRHALESMKRVELKPS